MSDLGVQWTDLWSVPPSSGQMRGLVPSRRIHSLPFDRRYPVSAQQDAEVLRRHQVVLDALRQGAESVVLLTYGYGDERSSVEPGSALVTEWVIEDDDEDGGAPLMERAFGRAVQVGELELASLVAASASEELTFAIVADDASWMFAPYHGGIDLFCVDENKLDAVWSGRPAWHPGNCECSAHSSERIQWDDVRRARAMAGTVTPHECDEMTHACADHRAPIEYDEVMREWLARIPGHPYSSVLEFCPWCAERLPESLNGPYSSKVVLLFGHDISQWPNPLRPAMPLEYQTDEWWRGRFANDDDGRLELPDGSVDWVLADHLPRTFPS